MQVFEAWIDSVISIWQILSCKGGLDHWNNKFLDVKNFWFQFKILGLVSTIGFWPVILIIE